MYSCVSVGQDQDAGMKYAQQQSGRMIYSFNNLMFTKKESSWCSWLSRLSNTQTVSSSNLDEDNFLIQPCSLLRIPLAE